MTYPIERQAVVLVVSTIKPYQSELEEFMRVWSEHMVKESDIPLHISIETRLLDE